MTYLYFIKSKDEAKYKVKEFHAYLKARDIQLQRLRTNGGREYNNREVLTLAAENGFSWEPTIHDTP